MDPINNRDNLFSRGPSPPPQVHQQFQVPSSQIRDPHGSPQGSIRDIPLSSNNHLDALLHNLAGPPPQASHSSPQPSNAGSIHYAGPNPQDAPVSGPGTPASIAAHSVASTGSAPSNSAADRNQNVLLSLMGAVGSPSANLLDAQNQSAAAPPQQQQPQQIPTPPGSAPRSGPSSENQGKMLLEQLMSGTTSKYNPEPQPAPQTHPGPGGPSPTYSLAPAVESQPHFEGEQHYRDVSYSSQDLSQDMGPGPGPQSTQQRPPSPARRSMFEFVSPFDALQAAASSQAKRKPAPSQAQTSQYPQGASTTEETSWNPPPVDAKRKSVENLMEHISRGQAPLSPPRQPVSINDPYAPATDETYTPVEPAQPSQRAPRPLPPQPSQQPSSPRSSPPKGPAQRQQRRGAGESPSGQIPDYPSGPQREKETSPFPTGYNRRKGRTSPVNQVQNIIIDVSRPLEEIQAPRDAVKSTAIALVRVDSTFLPGTTIGATHWVAYAMTKGRVRVISRSSGDRTLLTLPSIFPPTVAVTDMSVHGNRLAGVTSDGGFVVWELPEIIRDDVPGNIMLCVLPTADMDPLRAVKWHPQDPDIVTVTSDNNIYLINIADAAHIFAGQSISQSELHRVATVWSVSSPVVAFDYDIPRQAIGTISEDSTLTMWNLRDRTPFWSNKIRGDDLPSSLMFLERGAVIGRKNGTIFQLLPIMSTNVHSTIKFVNGDKEDTDMFGHANYDSRIQTLWIANNRRESMFAFKIDFALRDSPRGDEPLLKSVTCDQIVEFSGPKPTIHFVILTADADPTGEEAHAACVAAKVAPGELALVAFSVHSSGVDQILIRKEWYTSAFARASSKFPLNMFGYAPSPDRRFEQVAPPAQAGAAPYESRITGPAPAQPRELLKTPPSEEVEGVAAARDEARPEGKGKGKGKNVNWKDKEDSSREKEARGKGVDISAPDSGALVKEIRKVEDNIHTRLGRLISKELDKQHQRLEEARVSEQAADFVRQEKILKLISTELTKNTTRVVEMAVKAEVQNSVLPSLENITKTEVKAALNNQVGKGLSDAMKQHIPTELERILLRPDVTNHIARTFSATVTPLVERQIKETIMKTMPTYSQQAATMQQDLSREVQSEIQNLKNEVISRQNEALRKQELLIRDLEQSVRSLSDQVKYLNLQGAPHPAPSTSSNISINRSSPASSTSGNLAQLLRQPNVSGMHQPSSTSYSAVHGSYPPQPTQPQLHGPSWYGASLAAPQASHPTAPPPVSEQRTPPPKAGEKWDDSYVHALHGDDPRPLRELLSRSNPDIIVPLSGTPAVSQSVLLALTSKLSQFVKETPPIEEVFKSYLWWLHRVATKLDTTDPSIAPYAPRIVPNIQNMLNATKVQLEHLTIIPGGPSPDVIHAISNIQDIISQKPL